MKPTENTPSSPGEGHDSSAETPVRSLNFIETIVTKDLEAGKNDGVVRTRFPPEPNGYLHVGHAKSICLNFGLAESFGGTCNLRFDDTNPSKEEDEYVGAIREDVEWLGLSWAGDVLFASDYFEQLYAMAEELIGKGFAYVCDLSQDQTREYRGTGAAPGRDCPTRDRSIEENLDLFRRMRAGEFPDGAHTLRAKIDMASPNMNMRDPVMYRIMRATHHRTGDDWCIYPMYDYAHGQSDALEGITHSICTLEFENHRPLYDWFLDNLDIECHPQQIEFARLNLTYAVMSKRKLLQLVDEGHVSGWDDPRMLTIRGMRRRGYTPESIGEFCRRIGVAKFNSTVDMVQLENALRDDLNRRAERRMAVLRPIKVVIENFPEDRVEEVEAVNNPEDPSAGMRKMPLTREVYIDADDFREDPPRKYHRLSPGKEVRLRYGYCITCTEVVKNDAGDVVELRCTYDPETGGGQTPDGRKVKGIIHWVSASQSIPAEVRLYDHLFSTPNPDDVADGGDFKDNLNPDSLERLIDCRLERNLAGVQPGDTFQFERLGYFTVDTLDSKDDALVFNRAVSLRDAWARIEKQRTGGK